MKRDVWKGYMTIHAHALTDEARGVKGYVLCMEPLVAHTWMHARLG